MNDQTPFGLACPDGEPFYACDNGTRFLGCCAPQETDVCANGCKPDGLRAATFDRQYYSNITHNDCDTTIGPSEWYTCGSTSPPFLGCCLSNACASANGCSQELAPAKLSTNEAEKAPFLPLIAQEPTSGKTPSRTIVGGAIGGVVFVISIGCLVWYRVRKFRKSNAQHLAAMDSNRDQNLTKSPASSPPSPEPKHEGSGDIETQGAPQELHTESARLAEIASSDAPPPVAEFPSPEPAFSTQLPPTRPAGNSPGFQTYLSPNNQPSRAPGSIFGGPITDSYAATFQH